MEANPETKQALTVDITCTPCQHFTGRTLWDTFETLWAGWAVEEVYEPSTERERSAVKVFFGGDTAYRSVLDGQDEDKVPICPAFKEVGEVFGWFDFAMIPIGCVVLSCIFTESRTLIVLLTVARISLGILCLGFIVLHKTA